MGADLLLLVSLMSMAGALMGAFTGLVPGIHVNTLATMMLASYPSISSLVSGFAEPEAVPVLVSACIVSASVVHSYLDFVPSVFIGAPDPDEALTMLPGHRLLMEGRGMAAVRAAAVGSAVGSFSAVILAVPVQYIMLRGGAEAMEAVTLAVVIFVSAVVIFSADGLRGRLLAAALFAASGAMGLVCAMPELPSNGIFGEGTLLFPLLTGLFGIPPLLASASSGSFPEQRDCPERSVSPLPGIKGVITGCIAGWFPGITATAGAALSASVCREETPENFISLVASIGTVTSVFSLVTLSVTGSGRSGTSAVVKEIIGDGLEGFCSGGFMLLLLSVCLASAMGYAMTIASGRLMSKLADGLEPRKINLAVLIIILSLVLLMTGTCGIAVLATATLLGLVPQSEGSGRIPLTGCLMVPVIIGALL
jgi:putative membrane protein